MPPIALVTGATRGLGLEVARRLGERGATVLVSGRSLDRARAAAAELTADGLDAAPLELDVADEATIAVAAETIRAEHGVLDVLVNNAGILPEATAQASEVLDRGLFEQTFAVNLLGAVAVTERMLELLRASSAGRIVNVSTTMGSLGDQSDPASPYYGLVVPAYQASKAALNSVTIGLAKALADGPIKVNAVCPGFVQTDLTPVNREQAPLSARQAAEVVADYALLDETGPSGGFFDREAAVAW